MLRGEGTRGYTVSAKQCEEQEQEQGGGGGGELACDLSQGTSANKGKALEEHHLECTAQTE